MNNLSIQELIEADLPFVQQLQPHDWGDIIPNTRFYIKSDFCFPVKAILNNRIVGTGAAILNNNSAWLANIIVHPEFRNQGIGSKITHALMDLMETRAPTLILIGTTMGKPIYSKLGFRTEKEGDYIFFNKGQIQGKVSEHLMAYDEKFKQDIFDLDVYTTGERRQNILEPLLDDCFLYVKEGRLEGYLLAGFGEGLTIARSPEAGFALMSFNLSHAKNPVIPKANKAATEFLLQRGFSVNLSKTGTRMVWGKPLDWKPGLIYGRIGGNLG